ncbi:2-oxo acid dehydrogenase subunit E2 [Erwinia sp. MYb535]|uniref:2-oxo acid dehydrogenase subunit E2 n=1 Tax=Erwinia sp. MYb535 TaxID=2745309 RepID=UPI00309E0246
MMKLSRINPSRKQTLVFLELSKNVKGVTLINQVNIDPIKMKMVTSILVKSISIVLQEHPDLNCMLKYGSHNKLIFPDEINARITSSEKNQGVISFQVKNSDKKTIKEINDEIKQKKIQCGDKHDIDRKIMLIRKLPLWLGILFSKLALLVSDNQISIFSSFTVTSFGQQSQHVCIPISGSTFTFTMGAPFQNSQNGYQSHLVMIFDHRVLDGMQAASFLNDITTVFNDIYWSEHQHA